MQAMHVALPRHARGIHVRTLPRLCGQDILFVGVTRAALRRCGREYACALESREEQEGVVKNGEREKGQGM